MTTETDVRRDEVDRHGSGIREIMNLVLEKPAGSIARLEIGEPDGTPPAGAIEAGLQAIRDGARYGHSAGMPQLREELARRMNRAYGDEVDAEQVIVAHGAVEAIAAVFTSVLAAGDEVLVPDPGWPNYEMLANLVGARAVRYPLDAQNGFVPAPDELARLFSERTRIVVLNSPGNPTGAVADADTIAAVVTLAVQHGALVVSDEVYDEIVFDHPHVNARRFAPDSVVGVYSFSKTYCMTGWRIGYAVVPRAYAGRVENAQEALLSCLSPISQRAALAALTGPQDSVQQNRERYRARRDRCVAAFEQAGITVTVPQGAFYLMVPIPAQVTAQLAARELVEWGVSVAPGTAFGEVAQHFIRISMASSDVDLDRGVAIIIDWLSRWESEK